MKTMLINKYEAGKLILVGENVEKVNFNSKREYSKLIQEIMRDYKISRSLGAAVNPMTNGYASAVRIENGDAAFDTMAEVVALDTMAAGVTKRVWEMAIPPRYMYVWGSGIRGEINNQGYLYFVVADAATGFVVNLVTLAVESYDRHKFIPVDEFLDSSTHLTDATSLATSVPTNNQTQMRALPMTKVIAMPYSRLAINCKCIVATTTPDIAQFLIPVTVNSG